MLSTKKFMFEILNLAEKIEEAQGDDGENPIEIEEERLFYWITFILGYNFLIREDENPGTIKVILRDVTPQIFFLSSSTEVFVFHYTKNNDDILKVIKNVHQNINLIGKQLEQNKFKFESKLDEKEWNISFIFC